MYQLVGRVWEQLLADERSAVVFKGRTLAEAKRQMIKYWFDHEGRRGIGLAEFRERCQITADGQIVYRP